MASFVALAHELRDGWEYQTRLAAVAGTLCVSALYLKLVVARLAPGLASYLLLTPVVAANAWLPLLFQPRDEIISATLVCFLVTWLATFKARSR